ncbi:hypothetical protein ACO0QE_003369 [Hanseniaspora vineae]
MGYIHFDRVTVPNDNLGISLGQLHEQLQDIERYEQKLLNNKENYEYKEKNYDVEMQARVDNGGESNETIGNINTFEQTNYFEADEKNFDVFLNDIMGYTSASKIFEDVNKLEKPNLIDFQSLPCTNEINKSVNETEFYEESLDEEMNWNHYLSFTTTSNSNDANTKKASSHDFINEIFDASVLSSPNMSFTMSPISSEYLLSHRDTRDSVSSINSVDFSLLNKANNNNETSKKSRGRPKGSSNNSFARKVIKPDQQTEKKPQRAKYVKKYVPKHIKEMHCVVINGITIRKTDDGKLPCPYCNTATFKEKAYLIRHMKKHNPIKDFKCPFWNNHSKTQLCHHSGEFTRKDAFKAHLSSLHFAHDTEDLNCFSDINNNIDVNETAKTLHKANTPGRCAECFQKFGSLKEWLTKHIETGQCSKMLIKDCAEGQKLRRSLEKKKDNSVLN